MRSTAKRSIWRQAIRWCLAATLSRRLLLVSGAKQSQSICLTFDDGPHPEHTGRILDILKREAVPATFFVVGREAEKYPETVRRIVAEGHTLGHHSFLHGDPARTSANQLLAEVRQTQAVLSRIAGTTSSLFRPPHGKVTASKLWRLWSHGLSVVLWNVDPSDYRCHSAEELRGWIRQRPLKGGDVVLMHDNVPHGASVLRELIHDTRRRGLTFTTPLTWLR